MILYIHIPFCHRICPYCSFYKHTPGDTDIRAFIQAIIKEARSHDRLGREPIITRPSREPITTRPGREPITTRPSREPITTRPSREPITTRPGREPITTLYLGGGTPSMLSPSHLRELFDGLNQAFNLTNTHITLEANPATFGPAKAKLFKDLGVNRTSLGIQSFSPHVLKTLGREHNPEQAIESTHILRDAGMEEINIDLMFAIPGQTINHWKDTLDTAVSLQPDHISAYNLTYEEDTAFIERLTQGEYQESEDTNANQFQLTHETLTQAGFHHYETSNYARPGKESQHNLAYWHGHDYLGLGPSAVSTIDGKRWKNLPDTPGYINAINTVGHAMREAEIIDADAFRIERIALLLRTTSGLPQQYLQSSPTGAVQELIDNHLAKRTGNHLQLINDGPLLVDPIAAKLI